MKINFTGNWNWDDLKRAAKDKRLCETINKLEKMISIEDARFISRQLISLQNPDQIKELATYQDKQKKLGAWVDGLLPDQLKDENKIILPKDLEGIINSMYQLSRVRYKNFQRIEEIGEYPLEFSNEDLMIFNDTEYIDTRNYFYPDCWKLDIDLSVVKQSISFINDNDGKFEKALSIAKLPPNQEMLSHRKNLGYLPEPVTTTEDLANLLILAQSQKPLDLIWKWLNPMNFFDFADIYYSINKYQELVRQIENSIEKIKSLALGTIYKYIKLDIQFKEKFALTIGHVIRGWATDNMCGANIEYIKDNINTLLFVITHELIHRLQARILSERINEIVTFDEIIKGSSKNPYDNKFEEVLKLIMLEGSAEFIARRFKGKRNNEFDIVEKGISLLEQIFDYIYEKKDLDRADELLIRGLKSNGPFYSLGEYLTECIVKINTPSYYGYLLQRGPFDFFIEGFNCIDYKSNISEKILSIMRRI